MNQNFASRRIAPEMRANRGGVSLAEVILALTIASTIVGTMLLVFAKPALNAKRNACRANCELLNTKAFLFFQHKGVWPSSDLHELIGAMPICPLDETEYRLDARSHQVIGHQHK